MRADELPLFPLRSVLFPGGELRLRIFETRYIDLVRFCTREGRPFGVCLILEGEEAGAPARPAAQGTAAMIDDFYTLPDGMLGIRCMGGRRFHVERTKVRDNGLIVGEVRWLDDDEADLVRPEHALLSQLLERILEQVGGMHAQGSHDRFERAHWVSCRLAELLPYEAVDRQRLLESVDAHARLQQILDTLPGLDAGE